MTKPSVLGMLKDWFQDRAACRLSPDLYAQLLAEIVLSDMQFKRIPHQDPQYEGLILLSACRHPAFPCPLEKIYIYRDQSLTDNTII